MTICFLDTLKLMGNIISNAIFLTYYKLGKVFHLCGGSYYTNFQNRKQSILIIVFIGDKIYNPVSLNTRAIYNVLTDKKKRAPSCVEKWSENYPIHCTKEIVV